MLNKVIIALGLLMGSFLAAWGASSTLSNLAPGNAISGSDLFYDVQVVGVGGVKVTGSQFLNFVFGNVSGNCSATPLGAFTCVGGNSTGIAAGTNITTSGTGNNVTINVVATPTFTSITTTLASVTGWLTAAGVNMQTATIAGNLTGSTAAITAWLTASGVNMQTASIVGNLTGSTANFASNLTAKIAQFPGFLTASGANLNTATIQSLGATTQCVESVAGLLTGTGSTCGTGQFSINAGTNIVTGGTANNITVSTILTPTFTSVTTTLASVTGWLTAAGVNMQTATVAGNLTGSTAQFTGLLTGTNAVFQTVTVNNLTPTGPNCLQETGGVIQATNATCGTGSGGTPGGSNTQVQFNNSNAFAGDPGFTYTTPAAVVITSGIVTTNTAALSIFQTWNSSGRTFDAPLFVNITDTAFHSPGFLMDVQAAGVTQLAALDVAGQSTLQIGPTATPLYLINNLGNGFSMGWTVAASSGSWFFTSRNVGINNNANGTFSWTGSATDATTTRDTALFRDFVTAGVVGLYNPSSLGSATGFRVYNTINAQSGNAITNWERGVFDWTVTANNLTIGTQAGGTGVGRNVLMVASGTLAQTISSTATTFAAAINAPAIAQLSANTTGYACWTTGTGAISEDSVTCLASLRKLKKDIVPFTDTTAELMALKPSQFQWKNPADFNQRGQQLGFIAEDVHDVDARLSSYDGSGSLHGWRQDAMIAALVRGFQEQQAVIREQQNQIEELKRRLH